MFPITAPPPQPPFPLQLLCSVFHSSPSQLNFSHLVFPSPLQSGSHPLFPSIFVLTLPPPGSLPRFPSLAQRLTLITTNQCVLRAGLGLSGSLNSLCPAQGLARSPA